MISDPRFMGWIRTGFRTPTVGSVGTALRDWISATWKPEVQADNEMRAAMANQLVFIRKEISAGFAPPETAFWCAQENSAS